MYQIGEKITFTLFGKSHGPCVGGILSGIPSGFSIDMDMVAAEMELRKPTGKIGTPRREKDDVEFIQGVRDGITDGNPILMRIANGNTDGSKYMKFYETPRPGHADLPALLKFPDHDLRGSGQFSGRLTAAIVAAGAIAKQYIAEEGIRVEAFTRSVGNVRDDCVRDADAAHASRGFATRACTRELDDAIRTEIESAGAEKDSVGGVVECIITGLPIGFGGIWFDALDSDLARAMFGIPACKGVEFGDGFDLTRMRGSESNDAYRYDQGRIVTESNHMGGIVGGMCDGAPVVFRVAFKPTPSIGVEQRTVNLRTEEDDTVSVEGRHDPCIVPRAVAVVEAMAALTVADQMMRGYRWN
ncbi:MAG: chorismate synthase [Candidatus Methanomethylophilaceae archaeon]|nr:chorismate synthase [Candidatus Methanomethylophilaceae archaeon]